MPTGRPRYFRVQATELLRPSCPMTLAALQTRFKPKLSPPFSGHAEHKPGTPPAQAPTDRTGKGSLAVRVDCRPWRQSIDSHP